MRTSETSRGTRPRGSGSLATLVALAAALGAAGCTGEEPEETPPEQLEATVVEAEASEAEAGVPPGEATPAEATSAPEATPPTRADRAPEPRETRAPEATPPTRADRAPETREAAPAEPAAESPEPVRVAIRDFSFQPARVEVGAGTTVIWTNRGEVAHTVTASDGSWNSGNIEPGGTWRRTFGAAGTHGYTCTPHPNMTGSVVVTGG